MVTMRRLGLALMGFLALGLSACGGGGGGEGRRVGSSLRAGRQCAGLAARRVAVVAPSRYRARREPHEHTGADVHVAALGLA